MATLLNGNDTNRLVEVLAGSTSLLSDTGGDNAPLSLGALLGGDDDSANVDVTANAATPAAADDGPLVTAGLLDPVTDIVDNTLGTDTSNLLGIGDVLNLGTNAQLALAGAEGGVQPVFDATNILIKDVHFQLEAIVDQIGVPTLGHAITNLGETVGLGTTGAVPPAADDGHSNLVTDLVNAPSTLLNGGLDELVGQIGADLGDTLDAAVDVVGALLNGNDALNPLPELVSSLGNTLTNLPLLNINGGDSAGDGGLLGGGLLGGGLLNGVVGDLTGSSSGHLIDIDAGPETTGGLGLDLLAAPGSEPTHTASINAIDVGPNGPHLLDLGVLTGAGIIDIPGLGGAGTDGLTGNLLGGDLLGGLGGEGVGNLLGGDGLVGGLLGPEGPVGGLLGGDLLGGIASGGLLNGDIASGNSGSAPVTAPLDLAALTSPLTGDHGILDLHGAHIL